MKTSVPDKVTVIITSFKEVDSIYKCISQVIKALSTVSTKSEILFVCPDKETTQIAKTAVKDNNYHNFIHLKDPQKGKPFALNLAFKKAKGNILILTDGDVYIDNVAIKHLLVHFTNKKVGAVSGRAVCTNSKDTFWGYTGHMFMDAAHKKRSQTANKFFLMSGYLFAMRNFGLEIPTNVLDDVYISYKINNSKFKISYEPKAIVFVEQPDKFKSWIKQKVRSITGTFNIKKIFPENKNIRSLDAEIAFLLFPIKYAQNIRQLFWSILNYPLRLYIWVIAFWKNRIEKKSATDIWYEKKYRDSLRVKKK